MIVRKAKALPIEAIVRGYLGGSVFSWYNKETWKLSTWQFVGKWLQLSSKFNEAQFTPSTKAKTDVNIDKDNMHEVLAPWLIENWYDGIDPKVLAKQIEELSIRIYNFWNKKVQEKGSFIFDTKFEFGLDNDWNLVLIDEILTPDSSRFCKKDWFREWEKPVSADKQFVRDYVEAIWKKYPRSDWEGYPVVLPDHIIKQTEKNYAMMRQLFS
jgi:phosphoribosylaminoimidazole-succinocarboxamide synthase